MLTNNIDKLTMSFLSIVTMLVLASCKSPKVSKERECIYNNEKMDCEVFDRIVHGKNPKEVPASKAKDGATPLDKPSINSVTVQYVKDGDRITIPKNNMYFSDVVHVEEGTAYHCKLDFRDGLSFSVETEKDYLSATTETSKDKTKYPRVPQTEVNDSNYLLGVFYKEVKSDPLNYNNSMKISENEIVFSIDCRVRE